MGTTPTKPTKITLFISIEAKDKYLRVECEPTDTVQQLKQIIEKEALEQTGDVYEAKGQTLVYHRQDHRQTLEDSQIVEESGVKDEEIIFMYKSSTDEKLRNKTPKVRLLARAMLKDNIETME